jgi:hypothetical protein
MVGEELLQRRIARNGYAICPEHGRDRQREAALEVTSTRRHLILRHRRGKAAIDHHDIDVCIGDQRIGESHPGRACTDHEVVRLNVGHVVFPAAVAAVQE